VSVDITLDTSVASGAVTGMLLSPHELMTNMDTAIRTRINMCNGVYFTSWSFPMTWQGKSTGALVDPDDAHIPGAYAGPDGEFEDCAVIDARTR